MATQPRAVVDHLDGRVVIVLAWPACRGRSLAVKIVNWAADPSGSLPALPAALPMGLDVTATRGAAHAIGVDDIRGAVAPGKMADLLLVDVDPSADIRHTRRIRYVIKDGRIVFANGGSAR